MSVIAFDLDGTLEDSRVDMVRSVERVRGTYGLANLESSLIRPHVNRGMEHLYRTCFAELFAAEGEAVYGDLKERYEADYGAHIADHTRLYEGIAAALESLHSAGQQLALVTNKPEGLSRALLDALGVAQFFRAVIGGDTCQMSKPSPVPLQEAIRLCGGGPAVMIGDSKGDIRCARACSVPIIWCAWGYAEDTGTLIPDRVASGPSDLPRLARELLER